MGLDHEPRGDVAYKTDKNTGGHGGLVSRDNVSPSSVATTHNIDDPEAVVNVTRAAVVNIGEVANVNAVLVIQKMKQENA